MFLRYFRTVFLSTFLLALTCTGCDDEKPAGPGGLARLELSTYSVRFESYQKSSETFTIVSTRDWTASCTAGWVALTQTEGPASSDKVELTLYVTRNDDLEREAEIIFVNGRFTKVLKIVQAGKRVIEYTSIADVRSYHDTGGVLPPETIIKGTVISDRHLNNLSSYRIAYIQDETAGIQFYFSDRHYLDLGDVVTMDLSGCKVGDYYGSIQIEGLSDSVADVIERGQEVEPMIVSVSDLMENRYDGRYVAVGDVRVADEYSGMTWASKSAHRQIGIDAGRGYQFYVMTSKYADKLYDVSVPGGTGMIRGIASVYDEGGGKDREIRMIFTRMSDFAGLE